MTAFVEEPASAPATSHQFGATPAGERLDALDALRGFALCGILVANLVSFTGFYAVDAARPGVAGPADRAVLFAIDWLIEGKFYGLFSLLFGVGFALQVDRARRAGIDLGPIWRRRMGMLLAAGVTHLVFLWYGDLLTLYSLLGLALPFAGGWSDRRLAWTCGVLFALPIGIHVLVAATSDAPFWTLLARRADDLRHALGYAGHSALEMHTSASAREVLAANVLGAIQRPMSYLRTGRIPQVLGLFLLGVWLARRTLPTLRRGAPIPTRPWALCLVAGLPLNLAYAWLKTTLGTPFDATAIGVVQGAVYHAGSTMLAVGYAGAFIALARSHRGRAMVKPLVVLGRLALTNYLGQTVIALLVFSGYGLGRMAQIPFWTIPAVAGVILLGQWGLSSLWLRRHRQGPVEWLWRAGTYRPG